MLTLAATYNRAREGCLERLRHIREQVGYSQQDLADASGVSQHTISEIELGRRKPQGRTLRKLAKALGVEVSHFYGEPTYPKEEAPPNLQPSFNGLLEEERRSRYLRSWRAFVWKLVHRWEADPPKTSREIAVVLDTMQALIDEGAFEQPPEQITTADEREASEWLDLSMVFRGLRRLNEIADTVEEDETAQRRRELLRSLPGGLSA
jgi:transcriptional regulator with XRE-family HTH domain